MAPSRSATSSPPVRVVNANPFVDCVRTIYGWFRRWLALGLFDALLREVARRRRRKGGRRPGPTLAIIDTQAVKCIAVRGPRGYDAAKGVVGRKRVALVDAEGNWLAVAVVPASVQDRDTPEALGAGKGARPGRWGRAGRAGRACGRASTTARSRPSAAASGRTAAACATAWSPATRRPRASSCSPAAGWWRGASAGCPTGAASPGTAAVGSTSRPPASPSSASSPASRRCSTRCRSAPPHGRPTQTDGVIGAPDRGVAAPPGWWSVVGVHRPRASRRSSREVLRRAGRIPGRDHGVRGRRGGSDRAGGARPERAGGAGRVPPGPGARAGAGRAGGVLAERLAVRGADRGGPARGVPREPPPQRGGGRHAEQDRPERRAGDRADRPHRLVPGGAREEPGLPLLARPAGGAPAGAEQDARRRERPAGAAARGRAQARLARPQGARRAGARADGG